jgi:E3 ubiquitin-protein ligase HERC2
MYGQLGTGGGDDSYPTPSRVTFSLRPNTLISSAAAGMFHSVALSQESLCFVWGQNDKDQLGGGSTEPYSGSPILLHFPGGESISRVCCGADFTLALSSRWGLYFWGSCPHSGLKHSRPTRLYVGDGVEEFSGFVAAHWGSVGGVEGRNDGKIYLWGKPRGGKVLERPTYQSRIKSLSDVLGWASSPWGMTEPVVL